MISGVWVPLVTPFREGQVDLESYRRLVEHYLARGVAGLFPLGTTGEAPTLDADEQEAVVEATIAAAANRAPVFVGIGGNATRKVIKTIDRLGRLPFRGIVSVCPYYNRPTQDGLLQHFTALSDATDR
jgi:4-hydroxy-tetrahydrodipicolinate synthase